jgi:hypothetical protein
MLALVFLACAFLFADPQDLRSAFAALIFLALAWLATF